jgi:hypothetical protein
MTGIINCNSKLSALALQIAQGQIGQAETPKGSNSGPMVNQYLRSVGLNPGFAWCQAFVYWCYRAAAVELNIYNPMIKTAGVVDCWNRSKTGGGLKRVLKADALSHAELIKPGDQFILSFDGTKGHTGIVEQVMMPDSKGDVVILHTIEGNSNNSGLREGYEVVRHVRKLNDKALLGFIQYT